MPLGRSTDSPYSADRALKERQAGPSHPKRTVTTQACGVLSQDLRIPIRPTVAGTVPESSQKKMNRVPFSLDYVQT